MARKPHFVEIMDAIGETPTRGAERTILLAAVRWVNYRTGVLFPSVDTWMNLAGVTGRTVRRALRKLESKGLLKPLGNTRGGISRTGRGLSTKYQLLPNAGLWPDAIDEEAHASTPGHSVQQGGQRDHQRRTLSATYPDTVSAKPIQQHPNELPCEQPPVGHLLSRIHGQADGGGGGWSPADRETGLKLLIGAGVKIRVANKILDTGVTAAQISAEISDIRGDLNVANLAGVLVHRLLPAAGSFTAPAQTSMPSAADTVLARATSGMGPALARQSSPEQGGANARSRPLPPLKPLPPPQPPRPLARLEDLATEDRDLVGKLAAVRAKRVLTVESTRENDNALRAAVEQRESFDASIAALESGIQTPSNKRRNNNTLKE